MSAPSATRDILQSHLRTIHGAVRRAVEDITDDESLVRIANFSNNARWLTGHIILYTQWTAAALGCKFSLPEGWTELFKTGGTASSDPNVYPSMETLRERLFDNHRIIQEFLEHVNDVSLQEEIDLSKNWRSTRMGAVLFLAAHDFYHVGQLEVIRRQLGRERNFG